MGESVFFFFFGENLLGRTYVAPRDETKYVLSRGEDYRKRQDMWIFEETCSFCNKQNDIRRRIEKYETSR